LPDQTGPTSGTVSVPVTARHPVVPLEVEIRDLYPVNLAYGDHITATLLLRNASKESLSVPCSRNFRDVSTEASKDRRDLSASMRLMEGKIPVDVVVAVFTGSTSVPGSMCAMPPGGTIVVRGQGVVSNQPNLEDPRLARTTLNVKASVSGFYYNEGHVLVNYSKDCVSTNSVSLFFLGKKLSP
jgi:hypothetical protein